MKHLTADKWYAPRLMGQANAKLRRAFLCGIAGCLIVLALYSLLLFLSRFNKERENDHAYIVTFPDGERMTLYEHSLINVWVEDVLYTYEIPDVPFEKTGVRVERIMADFGALTKGAFLFLMVIFFWMVTEVLLNYRSFQHPSKAVYTIGRISDWREMHRRCLLIPVTAFLIGVLFCIGLGVLFYTIYLKMTPPDRIPEQIEIAIWRMLV